jgi:hypothetical protein
MKSMLGINHGHVISKHGSAATGSDMAIDRLNSRGL